MEDTEAVDDPSGKVKKLKELFGCTEAEANGYLEAFNYDIEKASATLVSLREGPASPLPSATVNQPVQETATAASSQMASGNKDYIDLTSNPDEDLKRALQLSLEEQQGGGSGGISYEDQQLSRAVEQSLAETREAAQMMGMSSVTFFTDPLNPHERKRRGKTPVGLKNLGNTCWFSVVVQALFHQPSFRRMVLKYSPPSQPSPEDAADQQPHNLCVTFMQELRNLFSLMIHSQKKYVDPGAVVKVCHDLHAYLQQLLAPSGAQQDMTEFIHKFLEWLEDAFVEVGQKEEEVNPMEQLFYGQCQTVGMSEGLQFVNDAKLGAYPLEVRGCTDLYESLAAATFSKYGTGGEARRSFSHDSIHECWFSRLPPVMILELSRFEFDHTSKRVEKINDQLTFPPVLYMDRFLLKNKKDTLQRHSREVELRVKLEELKEECHKLMNYGGKPVSLVDLFSLVLHYAEEKVAAEAGDLGVDTLQSKLQQWRTLEERKLETVKEEMDATQHELSKLYADPVMMATPYRLHAVCVHQGDASLGHYWVYINAETSGLSSLFQSSPETMDLSGPSAPQPADLPDQTATASRVWEGSEADPEGTATGKDDAMLGKQTGALGENGTAVRNADCDKWLKFNDVNVSVVAWDDVQRESFGDSRNTSAYCVIYVADDGSWEEKGPGEQETIPKDLQEVISHHNKEFEAELAAWDLARQRPTQLQVSSQPIAERKEDGNSQAVVPNAPSAKDWTEPATSAELGPAVEMEELPTRTLSNKLDVLVQNKCHQLLSYQADTFSDNRYLNVSTYCLQSGAPEYFCQLLALNFILAELESKKYKNVDLIQAVQSRTTAISTEYRDCHFSDKSQWCSMFQTYRSVCLHIVSSAKALNEKMYSDAVDHAMAAYSLNRELVAVNMKAGVDMAAVRQLLAYMAKLRFVQYAFHLMTTHHVLQLFVSGDHSVLEHCLKWLVPCVHMMSQDESLLFSQVTVAIRKEWCNRLEADDLPENLLDRLADFLSALMGDVNQDLKWHTDLKEDVAENSLETVCTQYCLVLQELSTVS